MAQQEGTLMASLTGIVFLGKNMLHLIEGDDVFSKEAEARRESVT